MSFIDGGQEDRTAAVVFAGIGMFCGIAALILSIITFALVYTRPAGQIGTGASTEQRL